MQTGKGGVCVFALGVQQLIYLYEELILVFIIDCVDVSDGLPSWEEAKQIS